MSVDHRQFIEELARRADLLMLAEKCGMDVVRDGARKPRACCPFHDDHRPSLQFYPKDGSFDRDHFHCFVCGAHGDVFSLVKELRKLDFWEAVQWVAQECGVAIPRAKGRGMQKTLPPRRKGLQEAARIYGQPDHGERQMLADFAKKRDFQSQFLMTAEVFAARGNKIVGSVAGDRELLEAMQEAGVIRQPEPARESGASLHLPIPRPPRDLYSTDRIVFTIRSREGEVVGFSGRAIGEESPKYLFTKQLPKGETLYRLDRVLNAIRELEPLRRRKRAGAATQNAPVFHVFVVEGLLDALRLELLGLHAVAVLGSQLSNDQARLISQVADEADRRHLQLAVHLFFDADTAGRAGMLAALPRLLKIGADGVSFGVDVIVPLQDELLAKHDPDDLFRGTSNVNESMAQLKQWCHSALDFLLAEGIGCAVGQLANDWPRIEVSLRMRAMRFVERQLDASVWRRVLDRLAPFEPWLREEATAEPSDWQDRLSRFLRTTPSTDLKSHADRDLQSLPRLERTDTGRLIHALQLAQASTQRRELPVDESSWARLKLAWDVVIPSLIEQLRDATESPEPMVAVQVPRGGGDFRLKALPACEDLILQQYVLYELLREVPSSRFLEMIPAVRYQSGLRSDTLQTTGPEHLRPVGGRTVSFAYQIDMDVLEGRTPPRREGMFRPYFDCWTDFISFVDRHVGTAKQSEFHVARLDIRRFYDSLPRYAVHDALLPALRDGLALLVQEGGRGPLACARLFRPGMNDHPDERARAIVDWLCDQSFGYRYLDPGTGELNSSQPLERGVPQGPDLSAYLANIALFPLDHDVSHEAQGLDAIYARYVDDMVIIAPTARDLNRLRAVIEDKLARLGLELSSKTEPLPPMRRDEVREWLTDNRGGLGVSGPFAGPPINEPLTALEPLADAGELDRTNALTLLHDLRMTDPETPVAFVLQIVRTARRAGNLRFNELIKSARILWSRTLDAEDEAGESSTGSDHTPRAVAERFNILWQDTESKEPSVDSESSKPSAAGSQLVTCLLAWLDGLESCLRRRDDLSPELSAEKQQRVRKRQQELAAQVHAGLCNRLMDVLYRNTGGRTSIAQYQHMIDLKLLAVHVAAGVVDTPASSVVEHLPSLARPSPAQLRFLFSLAGQHGDLELIAKLKHSGASHPFALRLLLHESIVRLATRNRSSGPDADPLERMRQPIGEQIQNWRASGSVLPALLQVLHLWLPVNPEDVPDASLALSAASALVRIAYAPCDVLQHRDLLANALLAGEDEQALRVELIPSPAGIGMPGIMGILPLERSPSDAVMRVDFEHDLTCCPSALNWELQSTPDALHPRFRCELKDRKLLKPLHGALNDPNTGQPITREQLPLWLAWAFASLVKFCRQANSAVACPPTAYNLLGPTLGTSNLDDCRWEILSHKVTAEDLIGQAFRRIGTRGLIAEPVKEHHAELWRIGTALADWLGMLEDSRRQASFRTLNSMSEEDPNHDWAIETLMRVALFRLRGISLPARALPLDEESELKLPRTITRILECLKTFPSRTLQENHHRRVAMLLAHLAENRAFAVRYDASHRVTDLSAPGAAVALLVVISRSQFRADEKLAEELPASTMRPDDLPRRRPVRAWCLLADRVRCLAEQSGLTKHDNDTTLLPLIVGSRLMAVTLQLRMQTLEHWHGTSGQQREMFVNVPPDLTPWDLDESALLHVNQEGSPLSSVKDFDALRQSSEPSNIQFLFRQLTDATADGSSNTWEALAGITPLGWCVALGSLLGFLRTPTQKVLVTPPADFTAQDEQRFRDLAQLLAVEIYQSDDVSDVPDVPWGDLKRVLSQWTEETTQSILDFLFHVDSVCGLKVTEHTSPHFRIGDGRKSHREVRLSDGDRDIAAWQIVTASAQREAANRGAERFQPEDDERWWYRWTETRLGDRLLSVGTVQPGLASLAGLGEKTPELRAELHRSQNPTAMVKPTGDSGAKDAPGAAVAPVDSALGRPPKIVADSGTEQKTAAGSQRTDGICEELWRAQSDSWRQREKLPCHLRIALFQWNVDDSYRHPLFDGCMRQQNDEQILKDIAVAREKERHAFWTADRANRQYEQRISGVSSCAEHRRQALLRASLRACREFKVEALLLPEYSIRPETVEWLREQLAEHAPNTWVWAGTYRKPPFHRFPTSSDAGWSALLSVIQTVSKADGTLQWSVTRRKKKYPAVAMGEQFAPLMGGISPMIGKSFDLRSKLLELICSEIFIVTSPSNLRSAAHSYRELLRKFGTPAQRTFEETVTDDISEDLRDFAKLTSMCVDPFERRSILLVPAMTSRAVDYTVLGQASYLAAGLTTVFCNAAKGNGYGQSCFIGHDGWDKDEKQLIGVPGPGPYHGVLPGIFRPFCSDRGWLGIKEQALVIADIDPFYSTEGWPRPQMLQPPLQLVAHLPIIESWQYTDFIEGHRHWCRCKLAEQRNPNELTQLVSELLDVIRGRSLASTVGDIEPGRLANILKKLSKMADHRDGDWLEKRRSAYLSEHAANPQPWPPPVALDWLYADLGDPTTVEFPRIEVPPYSRAPGEV